MHTDYETIDIEDFPMFLDEFVEGTILKCTGVDNDSFDHAFGTERYADYPLFEEFDEKPEPPTFKVIGNDLASKIRNDQSWK